MNSARETITKFAYQAINWTEILGLLIIVAATIIAVGYELSHMLAAGKVTLADLLLLFIYLEVVSMIGNYLRSGKLPVRMPIYIAIVALARYLILDMKNLDTWHMLSVAGAALILAIAVLVIRYGHTRFPYAEHEEKIR